VRPHIDDGIPQHACPSPRHPIYTPLLGLPDADRQVFPRVDIVGFVNGRWNAAIASGIPYREKAIPRLLCALSKSGLSSRWHCIPESPPVSGPAKKNIPQIEMRPALSNVLAAFPFEWKRRMSVGELRYCGKWPPLMSHGASTGPDYVHPGQMRPLFQHVTYSRIRHPGRLVPPGARVIVPDGVIPVVTSRACRYRVRLSFSSRPAPCHGAEARRSRAQHRKDAFRYRNPCDRSPIPRPTRGTAPSAEGRCTGRHHCPPPARSRSPPEWPRGTRTTPSQDTGDAAP